MFLVDKDPLDKFIIDLRERLSIVRRSSEEFISSGKCKDFTDYREKIGILRGIDMAIERLEELVKLDGAD